MRAITLENVFDKYGRNLAGCWSLLKTEINLHKCLKFSVLVNNSCVKTLKFELTSFTSQRSNPSFCVSFISDNFLKCPTTLCRDNGQCVNKSDKGSYRCKVASGFATIRKYRKKALPSMESRLHTAVCLNFTEVIQTPHFRLIAFRLNTRQSSKCMHSKHLDVFINYT